MIFKKLKLWWICLRIGLRNVIYYFPVIWKDRDWDWCFMMNLQKRKLESMIKYYSRYNCFVGQEIEVRYMKIALYCLNNIGNVKLPTNYVNDRNFNRIRGINGEMPVSKDFWKDIKEEHKEYYYNDVYIQKLWHLYHKILRERAQRWWD